MTTTTPSPHLLNRNDRALALALNLAHAENQLHALTDGQVDAIVDPDGRTHLLRAAQEHLLQSEKRLQAVIESTADLIMVVNRAGIILSHNHAMRRVFGHSRDELIGRVLFELVHEEDLPKVYAAFFNVIEEFQESASIRFRHQVAAGSFSSVEATVARLRDITSRSVVFSLRPMASPLPEPATSTVATGIGLPAGDRFLAMLSHELRTPLTPALLGIAELQLDERFAEAGPVLAMIRRNLETQGRLLEELKDFTGIGSHKVRLCPESIDVHEAIGFVVETCQSDFTAAKINLALNLRATETIVHADPVRLQQVMWNLLKNAIKFSLPGSRISIATRNAPEGGVIVEFADEGVGIEAGQLSLIFDCFHQSERPGQIISEGLGLGLFIAKGLTEAQGGTLTALSEGRGQGAVFRLTLPSMPMDHGMRATKNESFPIPHPTGSNPDAL
jgi:two-component system CheB/CheR fusion protein